MQCIIAYEAWPVGRGSELACRRLERPRLRVPVQQDYTSRLAPTYLHREAMNLHREVQCLNPLDRHPSGILTCQIVELGAIFDRDRLCPLQLAAAFGVIAGQRGSATHRLAMQVVMIHMQPVLVAIEAAPQTLDERIHYSMQPGRQRPRNEAEEFRTVPVRWQIQICRRQSFIHVSVNVALERRFLDDGSNRRDHRVRQSARRQVDPESHHPVALVV